MNKHNSGVIVSDLDRKLFRYLFSFKVATAIQIQRDIYKWYRIESVYRRLRKFQKQAWITGVYHHDANGNMVYSLNHKGFEHFMGRDATLRSELKSYATAHDLALVDIARALRSCREVLHYAPENVFKSAPHWLPFQLGDASQNLRPDALLQLSMKRGSYIVALEYEISLKQPSRYQELFDGYLFAQNIAGVFYVCATESVKQRIQEYEKRFVESREAKFFYATLRELHSATEIVFSNIKKEKIVLTKVRSNTDQIPVTDEPPHANTLNTQMPENT